MESGERSVKPKGNLFEYSIDLGISTAIWSNIGSCCALLRILTGFGEFQARVCVQVLDRGASPAPNAIPVSTFPKIRAIFTFRYHIVHSEAHQGALGLSICNTYSTFRLRIIHSELPVSDSPKSSCTIRPTHMERFAFLSYNQTPTHTKPTDWSQTGLLFSQNCFLCLHRYSHIPNQIPLSFNITVNASPFMATYSIATHYRQIMYCGSEKEKLSLSRGTWNTTLCAVISTAPEDGSSSSTTLRRSSPHTGLGNHIF